jgi:hypothetical protein
MLNPTDLMRNLLFLFLFIFCCSTAQGQQWKLTGTLKDTVNLTNTGYTSVSLIRTSDSVLQQFTRADEDGKFTLQADSPGAYKVLISHPNFVSIKEEVLLEQPLTDMGDVFMVSKQQLLSEVIITDARAIVIKGDTVEYTADSFQTRAYDNVDELLKKLPGIEMGLDGKIKAYGQEVKKMLVDGEEFFSDDPAVVAQTLRASAVDKVQVFDKKSDQAAFTGIDDGEKIKTINLQLKEDAKKGYMGKIAAGGGLPDFWENQAMMQAFSKKRKISAYGVMANTNNNGLGWSDRSTYGGNSGLTEIGDDGSITTTYYGNDGMSWDGRFNGEGLPKAWSGGAHYSNKWFDNDLSFGGSYRFGKNIVEATSNTRNQYILPDTQYRSEENNNVLRSSISHGITTTTELVIDTSTSLKLALSGSYNESRSASENMRVSESMFGERINDNTRNTVNNSESKSINANLLFRKKFAKKGRTLSATASLNWREGRDKGYLYSINNLYAIDSSYIIDQRKEGSNNSLQSDTRLAYTEPLSEVAFVELNYSLGINNRVNDRASYDRIGNGGVGNEVTDVYNPLFSSDYLFNSVTNRGGANIRFNYKKFNFSLGGAVGNTDFRQEDRVMDTVFTYSNLNFFPRATFQFKASKQTSLNLRYEGRTNQPQLQQIQPLRTNNDPLNIMIGNPDLKQEFRHNFSLNFSDYKVLKSRSIWASANFSFTQNAISERQDIDISGRRTYQNVNVDGNMNFNSYFSYSTELIAKVNLNLGGDMNTSRNRNFVNGLANTTTNTSLGPSIGLSYYKDTTWRVRYTFGPDYNVNNSTIRKDIVTRYWTYDQNLNASWNILRFTIGTTVQWNIRQRLDPTDRNNDVFRWNANISRSFLKDRSLVLQITAYDILNRNIGYRRFSGSDMITETTYNNIRRYVMLGLTWNFTQTGGKAPAGNDVIYYD